MISYFDTSAVIPLILGEPASERCSQLWNESVRVISTRLLYPEARAALAQAERMHRITAAQLTASVEELESIVTEIDYIEISDQVARAAGELAQTHGLRGYDAVHLASAALASDDELVFVTGDTALAAAAQSLGIAIAITTD